MRIKSNFKDYYDYVEFLYNPQGGDRSETYLRGKIQVRDPSKVIVPTFPVIDDGCIGVEVEGSIPRYPLFIEAWRYPSYDDFPWKFRWCSFCGKLYLLVADYIANGSSPLLSGGFGDYHVVREDHPVLEVVTAARWGWKMKRERPLFSSIFGAYNETCVNLSKLLNSPVLLIENFGDKRSAYNGNSKGTCTVVINPVVPNLGKLGFPAFMPPEVAYQEIAMFLGHMRDNPDQNPPINVSDRDRLIQKGFDAKASFRGKVPKPDKD